VRSIWVGKMFVFDGILPLISRGGTLRLDNSPHISGLEPLTQAVRIAARLDATQGEVRRPET
jgi:hypothetical protein